MVVPRKGSAYKGVVKRVCEWIDGTGYPEVVLKCDKEGAIKQLQNDVQRMRAGRITIPENNPTANPQSIGLDESTVDEIKGYIWTLKLELEEKIGKHIPEGEPDYRLVGTTCGDHP